MIVIVEGIDRIGKSTFCELLRQQGYKVLNSKIHTSEFTTSPQIYDKLQEERVVAQSQLLSLLDKSEKIVIDRFHLSQIVYGLLNRHVDTRYHMMMMEDLLVHNSMLVYLRPTDVYESSKRHGSDLSKHLCYFDELFEQSKLYKLDGTYTDLDNLVACVLEADNGN